MFRAYFLLSMELVRDVVRALEQEMVRKLRAPSETDAPIHTKSPHPLSRSLPREPASTDRKLGVWVQMANFNDEGDKPVSALFTAPIPDPVRPGRDATKKDGAGGGAASSIPGQYRYPMPFQPVVPPPPPPPGRIGGCRVSAWGAPASRMSPRTWNASLNPPARRFPPILRLTMSRSDEEFGSLMESMCGNLNILILDHSAPDRSWCSCRCTPGMSH